MGIMVEVDSPPALSPRSSLTLAGELGSEVLALDSGVRYAQPLHIRSTFQTVLPPFVGRLRSRRRILASHVLLSLTLTLIQLSLAYKMLQARGM